MAAAAVANGGISTVKSTSPAEFARYSTVYSELQRSRIEHSLPLPRVLAGNFNVIDGPISSAAGHPDQSSMLAFLVWIVVKISYFAWLIASRDEIAKLFPCVFGQPSSIMVPSDSEGLSSAQKLKIGVVLSGGQAPGGHNVICGIFDYLQARAKGSTIYGFSGGPAGIMKCKYVELTTDFVHPYRNQVRLL
ncbi:hypothetical protein KSS87_005944 [Heliosperma pusillum]|nr:hypothetical protein KSS87_005944 [Heliosperma pusillum]